MFRLGFLCNKTPLRAINTKWVWSTKVQTIRKPNLSHFSVVKYAENVEVTKSQKLVGKWLLGCGGMVFASVILGGVTRLTESGLSMVTWKPYGEKLPWSSADWEKEFENYKQYPEYKIKHHSMSLEEFKFIFTMEYAHRMWGRTIGMVFLIPAIWFWRKGMFCKAMKKNVLLLGSLIGAQGLMGWYMVKSGLEDTFQNVNDVPRVSQYRLASHLGLAFILYNIFLSTGMSKLLVREQLLTSSKKVLRFRNAALVTKGLIFVTAISGAFVAGLDAGLVYNSFPKMGDKWIPDDILAFRPLPKNITENPATVQFNHRLLGTTTLGFISMLYLYSKRVKLPQGPRLAINAVTIMAWLQVTLGVTTLLTYVPVPVAAAHQSGSLILLSLAIWLAHEFRFIKYIPK